MGRAGGGRWRRGGEREFFGSQFLTRGARGWMIGGVKLLPN